MDDIWEDFISRNAHSEPDLSALGPASEHREADKHPMKWENVTRDLDTALEARLRFVAVVIVRCSGDKSDKEESVGGFRCYGDCVLWLR